ncbi:MAG: anthranilate synthase component I family protein [Bacilli bacterium]
MTVMKTKMHVVREQVKGISAEVTPTAIFSALESERKFLLQSSLQTEVNGRYSFLGENPSIEWKRVENGTEVTENDSLTVVTAPFLDVVRNYFQSFDCEDDFVFSAGAVGYVGYDSIRDYEDIGHLPEDPIGMPSAHLMFFRTIISFDHITNEITLLGVYTNEEEQQLISEQFLYYKKILTTIGEEKTQEVTPVLEWKQSVSKEEFMKRVERLQHHIVEGDIFQVVPSLRFSGAYTGESFAIYERLKEVNPSPYMFYITFGNYTVLGASPESLISVRGRRLETNPIAGTRKRGASQSEDRELAEGLLQDPKELAEHYMLVDLGRNDVGSICEIGSVNLDRFKEIEYYSHVMHIVSVVSGTLTENHDAFSALQKCLPAGTVSGAPKIRAMQLINKEENLRRNVYAGSVGYISVTGDMDMALAIRTLVAKDGFVHLQAGAGVVYDSVPELEYEESLNKARALMEVLR